MAGHVNHLSEADVYITPNYTLTCGRHRYAGAGRQSDMTYLNVIRMCAGYVA